LMDEMRGQFAALIAREEQLLAERERRAHRDTWLVLGITSGLTLFFGCLLALAARRQLLLLSQSYERALAVQHTQSEELRRSEERYRRLVESSPEMIAVHSDGQFVFVNEAGVRLLGAASTDEILGQPVLEVIHQDDRALVAERMRRNIEAGQQTELIELGPAPRGGPEGSV